MLGAVRAWGKERKSGEKRTHAETAQGAPGSGSVPHIAVFSNYCFKYPGVRKKKKKGNKNEPVTPYLQSEFQAVSKLDLVLS